METLISVHIGDIHFGAFDSEVLYNELKQECLNKLKKLPRIDLIIIDGDFFHKELSFNDMHTFYALKFWNKLVKIARRKQCKYIRLIKGTKSHDRDQLERLPIYDDIDIQVINKVCKETLFGKYKILYLPEEYIKNSDEYYEEYFNDRYQLITGHGLLTETAFVSYESEVSIETAPVFNTKKLLSICDGPIIFGHIHDGYIIKKRVFYTGSFSRWKMGEENPKGFLINITNLDYPDLFKIITIENKIERKFVNIRINDLIKKYKVEDCILKINDYKVNNNIYKLRLRVKMKQDKEFIDKVIMLQDYYMGNKNITLDVNNNGLIREENEEDQMNNYDYLFDNTEPELKISKFIDNNFNYKLSPERISELLTNDILKLIDKQLK